MTVKNVPACSIPTSEPANEGNARKRNPLDPTALITLSIKRPGWEAGADDEVVEVDGAGVDGVDVDEGVLGVDEVEGVGAGFGAGVDVEAGAGVDVGAVLGLCSTYHAATYPSLPDGSAT